LEPELAQEQPHSALDVLSLLSDKLPKDGKFKTLVVSIDGEYNKIAFDRETSLGSVMSKFLRICGTDPHLVEQLIQSALGNEEIGRMKIKEIAKMCVCKNFEYKTVKLKALRSFVKEFRTIYHKKKSNEPIDDNGKKDSQEEMAAEDSKPRKTSSESEESSKFVMVNENGIESGEALDENFCDWTDVASA